ncbi:MAG TPA: HTTM domain-containing protein [Gemmatimonadales bacterium]|nr:HTTM domain-containing protein [Gemmatimonadales bacterium]
MPDLTRWLDRWNRYWFPPASTLNLAGARIVAVAAQLFWFFPAWSHQINLLTKNERFLDPQPIIRVVTLLAPREVIFTPQVWAVVYWGTFVAGLLALVGLFTRTSLFVLALGMWLLVGHAYSYADVHHHEALFVIFLMLLPLAPAGDRLSLDALLRRRRGTEGDRDTSTMAMWPLKLLHVLLSLTYFSTGITKLLSGGLQWMNGYTVATYTFGDAIQRHRPLGIWIAQHHTLCVLLGIGTIAFETFYFLSLFLPRLAPLFFLSGILFHFGLWLSAGQPFYEHMVMNAILLLFLGSRWRRTADAGTVLRRRPAPLAGTPLPT